MDRVAMLTAEAGSRRKRRAQSEAATSVLSSSSYLTDAQQRLDAKAAVVGKLQRTDTDHNLDEQLAADAGTQDSVQTAYHDCHQHHHQQQQQHHYPGYVPEQQQQMQSYHQQQQQLEAHEDIDGGSGSEVEGPIADDKYIKGTRLVIGGWFQACRGCNEPTAHTTLISRRDVPLCPRCQGKYNAMINGCYPPSSIMPDPTVEPLHYWLPRLLGPVAPLDPLQRRDFCDALVLRQDDAWLQLINMS